MKHLNFFTLLLCLLLAACGGGGGGSNTADPISNVAPVANAGASQTVVVNTPVSLDGNASSDANGDALSYAWTLSSTPTRITDR